MENSPAPNVESKSACTQTEKSLINTQFGCRNSVSFHCHKFCICTGRAKTTARPLHNDAWKCVSYLRWMLRGCMGCVCVSVCMCKSYIGFNFQYSPRVCVYACYIGRVVWEYYVSKMYLHPCPFVIIAMRSPSLRTVSHLLRQSTILSIRSTPHPTPTILYTILFCAMSNVHAHVCILCMWWSHGFVPHSFFSIFQIRTLSLLRFIHFALLLPSPASANTHIFTHAHITHPVYFTVERMYFLNKKKKHESEKKSGQPESRSTATWSGLCHYQKHLYY